MPVSNWVALAILHAAAEQCDLVDTDPRGEPSDIAEAIARLETKLDRLLASVPAGDASVTTI